MIDLSATERVVLRRRLAAPPETVFAAWVRPEHMRQWLAPADGMTHDFIDVDLRVGGLYRIGMRVAADRLVVVTGEYVEVDPPGRLVFTWTWERPNDYADHDTLVTVDFAAAAGGTDLTVTHERFPDGIMRDKHEHGWTGCLARLTRLVAAGLARPD